MQTIPEPISSTVRAPIEAQLELFNSIAMATVENTGRLALYQIDASRAALDQSCAAWRQLLAARPSNLFELLSQAQSNLTGMLDSARAPFAATSQAQPGPEPRHAQHQEHTAVQSDSPAPVQQPVQQMVPDQHAPQPPAHRTPIAEAASQVVADGPLAAPIAAAPTQAETPVTLPRVKPLDATPPPSHIQAAGERRGMPRK